MTNHLITPPLSKHNHLGPFQASAIYPLSDKITQTLVAFQIVSIFKPHFTSKWNPGSPRQTFWDIWYIGACTVHNPNLFFQTKSQISFFLAAKTPYIEVRIWQFYILTGSVLLLIVMKAKSCLRIVCLQLISICWHSSKPLLIWQFSYFIVWIIFTHLWTFQYYVC